MNISSISFENYKAFVESSELELKPITILIGKNSSGKSSIAKFFLLLENSLNGFIDEPLRITNSNVALGSDFRDLLFNRDPYPMSVKVKFNNKKELSVKIYFDNSYYKVKIYSWEYEGTYYEYVKENLYKDRSGNEYRVEFKGFIPTKVVDAKGKRITISILEDYKIDVDYIGPFRILPERTFTLSGQLTFDKTGIKGENAYAMLGISKFMDTDLHKQVSDWYEKNFDGWKLDVEEQGQYLEIRLKNENSNVNIVDVGQGMNQALPLVVRAHCSKKNSIIVLEQPELHLHPAAHADLAELFARSAIANNQFFCIETHSENILLRLRRLVVENDFNLKPTDIAIYWVDKAKKGKKLINIDIDENGDLSDWPSGVFNENLEEIIELRKAVKRKKNS